MTNRRALAFAFILSVGCTASIERDVGTSQQPLVVQVVEGESGAGAGTNVADASASGGQYRFFATPSQQQATYSVTTTIGATVTGRVRTTTGCAPLVSFQADSQAPTSSTVTSTSWVDVNLGSVGPGSHTMRVSLRGGCNLHLDKLTVTEPDPPPPPPPPLYVEAEGATGQGTVGSDATASGGQYRAFTASFTSATSTINLATARLPGIVRVRAVGCTSSPIAQLAIDGVTRVQQSVSTSGAWVNLPIGGASLGVGSHTIQFYDRSSGSPAGCSLQFDYARLD